MARFAPVTGGTSGKAAAGAGSSARPFSQETCLLLVREQMLQITIGCTEKPRNNRGLFVVHSARQKGL